MLNYTLLFPAFFNKKTALTSRVEPNFKKLGSKNLLQSRSKLQNNI